MEIANIKVIATISVTQDYMSQVYNAGNYVQKYFKVIQTLINQQLQRNVNISKKFNGKGHLTISLECKTCKGFGRLNINKDRIYDDPAIWNFSASCLHTNGNFFFKALIR